MPLKLRKRQHAPRLDALSTCGFTSQRCGTPASTPDSFGASATTERRRSADAGCPKHIPIGWTIVRATLSLMGTSARPLADPGTVSYLGRGIYDISEVSRLLCSGRALVEVCDDYRLTAQQVRAALDYELALAA